MIDPRLFRNALGRFATGVTVVTMRAGGETYGITVNAFMSVSLKPPLVAICIDQRANAHETLQEVERYGVSVLRAEQEALSDRFAGRPVDLGESDPFVEIDGFPLVAGALAQLLCRVVDVHEAGDHTLFIGEVERALLAEGAPLLYFGGRYAHVKAMELVE